ncbi:nucleotide-binding protein [Dactylosporangium matsuzakiense]|uniref:CD-NTase-associated protein 12/Pycsar effector protein TIR domain-containing protein n=1 Tax=Dactylosporangium matsuzakiense TaxID=53360 RepID=A0A9W6KDX3_9ACTN|nr:nucleotide-binding protein [Dactylosporangium matsuzakiense]UWZ45678.1 nucleotide-binding protein [Dactylosporangium matsuzakiense]GLL00301.1 hypothetical protein GCM10017581_020410 [Dactylosporangium matsuzakiense]
MRDQRDRGAGRRPSLFIGSSSEGLIAAEYIQANLDGEIECTVWNQDVFRASEFTFDVVARVPDHYDYAALVLTPDDVATRRGQTITAPRDNVLVELGLFMGLMGRDRTFVIAARDDRLAIPSDLHGLTVLRYGSRADGNLRAALGPACVAIRDAIQRSGSRRQDSLPA